MNLDDCIATHWDAIVVGTGIGGSTVGYALAKNGHKVLFVEKGPFFHGRCCRFSDLHHTLVATALTGAGDACPPPEMPTTEDQVYPGFATLRSGGRELRFQLPLGHGSGGSSRIYGGALERFWPVDFSPDMGQVASDQKTAAPSWPIPYEEFTKYYEVAERIFGVTGSPDPLYPGAPAPLKEPFSLDPHGESLIAELKSRGLHPYRGHLGWREERCPGRHTGCASCNCPITPIQDAAVACLIPALRNHDAFLLANCSVKHIDASREAVRSIVCSVGDSSFKLTAQRFFLACGAFVTPALLQRSRSTDWPLGIGNDHDLVGRYLMFHGGHFLLIGGRQLAPSKLAQKTLALNDYYVHDGQKLGTLQTLGIRLSTGQIMSYIRHYADSRHHWYLVALRSKPAWLRKVFSPAVRVLATVAIMALRLDRATIWATIVEDFPNANNRVYFSPEKPDDVILEYEYSADLRGRTKKLVELIEQALSPIRVRKLSSEDKIDFPHVCGTCRFGKDPRDSVLDSNNRIHGMSNLYVVDASFFPSSGGTNPSLTIAANALRVADSIQAESTDIIEPAAQRAT